MRRDEVIAILEANHEKIKSFGVKSLALFGSVARDQARPDRDVDLLVELDAEQAFKGLEYFGFEQYLADLLGTSVDVAHPGLLKDRIRDRILSEAIPIFPLCSPSTRVYPKKISYRSAKDWRLYIDDMLDAMSRIQRYTQGASFEAFLDDEMMIDAVVRNISIIGEAARKMLDQAKQVTERYSQIPWERMRNMRNIVIHQYDQVQLDKVWGAVEDIPNLQNQLGQLLEQEGAF